MAMRALVDSTFREAAQRELAQLREEVRAVTVARERAALAQKRDVWVKFHQKYIQRVGMSFFRLSCDPATLVLDPYGTFLAEKMAMAPSRLIRQVINIERLLFFSKRITTFPPEIHENIDYTQIFMAVVALTSENTEGYIWSISDEVNRKDNFSRIRTGMLLPAFKHAHFYFVHKVDDAYGLQHNMPLESNPSRAFLLYHGSRKWKMQGSNDEAELTNQVEADFLERAQKKLTVSSFSTCGLQAVVHYSEQDGMSSTQQGFYQGIQNFCFTVLGSHLDCNFWLTSGSIVHFVDQAVFLGKFRDGQKKFKYNRKIELLLAKVITEVFTFAIVTGAFSAPMYIPYFLAICSKACPNYHRFAITLQNYYRGHRARILAERNKFAITLQKHWRGILEERNKFAITLQKHWRGHRGRTRAERKRELKQKHDEHMAKEFHLEREKEQARHKLAMAERERKKMDLPFDSLARPQHGKKQWNQKKKLNQKTKHKNKKNTIKTAEFEHDDFVSPEHPAHRRGH